MVWQKRSQYGFNGYQVPAMPRASRSARGRGSFRKKLENAQMCAFDLLATVAGELLENKGTPLCQEIQSAPLSRFVIKSPFVKKEEENEEKHIKQEPCDQGGCDENVVASNDRLQKYALNRNLKDHAHCHNSSEIASAKATFDGLKKATFSDYSTPKSPNWFGDSSGLPFGNIGSRRVLVYSKVKHGNKLQVRDQRVGSAVNKTSQNAYCLQDPINLDSRHPALNSTDSSLEVPSHGDSIPRGEFSPRCHDSVKIPGRDDDENSSACTQPSNIAMKFFKSQHARQQRIKRLMASKIKLSPAWLKDEELYNSVNELKHVIWSRKMCYTRQRTQRGSMFKKRKLLERCSMLKSVGGNGSKGLFSLYERGAEAARCCKIMHGVSRASASAASKRASFSSGGSHVKLSIKSFKIPELVINISETATVGSLKRKVLEAVTSILGNGICVGVLLEGEKVRDDNTTLLQSGICHEDGLDGLGFALEPLSSTASPPPICARGHTTQPLDAAMPLTRYPLIPSLDMGASDVPQEPLLSIASNYVGSGDEFHPSPTDMNVDNLSPNSRALISIPPMNVEALAMVPVRHQSPRSEVQRRIRRPFSVTEVEALVLAVEKLGTGRWRDVKLRAFENAKHRTYVDLKDKWKTLVHTARISPQQRRGEQVPQELLDRVLAAHAYWSQQQAKQQLKQQDETCQLL